MNHCERHSSEPAADRCGQCGWGYCSRCLVYSFGPDKPPFCVGCALAAAGIRSGRSVAAAPKPDRKAIRMQRKAEKEAAKAAARAEKDAAKAAARAAKDAEQQLPEIDPLPAFGQADVVFGEPAGVVFAEAAPLLPATARYDTVQSRVRTRDTREVRETRERELPPFLFDQPSRAAG